MLATRNVVRLSMPWRTASMSKWHICISYGSDFLPRRDGGLSKSRYTPPPPFALLLALALPPSDTAFWRAPGERRPMLF